MDPFHKKGDRAEFIMKQAMHSAPFEQRYAMTIRLTARIQPGKEEGADGGGP